MKFLTGKDYPHLCSGCRTIVDMCVEAVAIGPDTDDEEAPLMLAGDNQLLCGPFGNGCEPPQEEGFICGQCNRQFKSTGWADDPMPNCPECCTNQHVDFDF